MLNLQQYLETAVTAAKKAGSFILNQISATEKRKIYNKKEFDFVTETDMKSEEIIVSTIKEKFPEHLIFTEESLKQCQSENFRWIIDPLDGTTNFIHLYPAFCVSIALEFEGKVILGVIFDPLRDELFTATLSGGAYKNNSPIRVSEGRTNQQSIVLTGFPFRLKEKTDAYLKVFKNIFEKVGDIRRGGSAALDLAYVAAGIGDGFFEIGLNPWDIAAGSMIIKEAGGIVTDFAGGENYLKTGNIVAGNQSMHALILKEIKAVFNEMA